MASRTASSMVSAGRTAACAAPARGHRHAASAAAIQLPRVMTLPEKRYESTDTDVTDPRAFGMRADLQVDPQWQAYGPVPIRVRGTACESEEYGGRSP